MRFAVLVAKFNPRITDGLRDGALTYLEEQGCKVQPQDIIYAPGAFEVPLLAKALAETQTYAGVICLGAVIKGDTAHFEFVSLGATMGIQEVSLRTGVPIAFGVLTTYTTEQALARAQDNPINKGREAAAACYETAKTLVQIRKPATQY